MVSSTLRRGFAIKALALAGVVLVFAALGASAAVAKKGGTNRPIKTTASGTSVLNLRAGAFVQDLKGHESHLGRITIHNTGTITVTSPTSFTLSGSGVTVAANGAKLFETFSGSGTNDAAGNLQGQVVVTFTGGTRRFTGASGVETGTFSAPPGTNNGTTLTSILSDSLKGTINY
jgi:hypothetical protein